MPGSISCSDRFFSAYQMDAGLSGYLESLDTPQGSFHHHFYNFLCFNIFNVFIYIFCWDIRRFCCIWMDNIDAVFLTSKWLKWLRKYISYLSQCLFVLIRPNMSDTENHVTFFIVYALSRGTWIMCLDLYFQRTRSLLCLPSNSHLKNKTVFCLRENERM